MAYDLRTDRDPAPESSVPAMGPAGSSIVDPLFGTKITRVTDTVFGKSIGAPGRSWSTGSGSEQNTWSSDSSAFIVQDLGGGVWIPFGSSGKLPTPNGQYYLPLNGPAFSYSEPRKLFGRSRDDASLCKYDLDSQTITTICRFPRPAVGEVSPSGNDRVVTFGNGSQDTATEVYLWDGSALRVLNTSTGMLDGIAIDAAGVSFPFGIHNARIDRSGRYVVITSSTSQINGVWRADAGSPLVVWDVDSRRMYLVNPNPNGHKCSGNTLLINQDVFDTAWDGMQWLIRPLAEPAERRSLINPVLQPSGLNRDSHLSWNNHTGHGEPVLISIYRNQNDPVEAASAYRAWDQELILVSTDSSGIVYRVCNHRTVYRGFWHGPHGIISPDGKHAVFASNWGETLGTGEDGEPRRDVFRVELSRGGSATPPVTDPAPTPVPTPAPAPTPSPDGTKALTITDAQGGVWTLGLLKETLRNGAQMGGGFGSIYKWLGGIVYVLGTNLWWYKWTGSAWQSVSQQEPGTTVATRTIAWPKQQGQWNALLDAQWSERFRLKRIEGNTATFEKVS